MQIEGIKLTKEEVYSAIEAFLLTHGLTVKVESFDSYGYPAKDYFITIKDPQDDIPVPTLTKAVLAEALAPEVL